MSHLPSPEVTSARVPLPPVVVTQHPPGQAYTEATIVAMARLASEGARQPFVRLVAERAIGNDLPARAYEAECARLLRFVREEACRYTKDPLALEWVRRPRALLEQGGRALSDCDEQSALFASLCMALGHEAGFRAIRADPRRPHEYSHVFPIVKPRDRWLPADPTEPLPLGADPARGRRTWGAASWAINALSDRAIRLGPSP